MLMELVNSKSECLKTGSGSNLFYFLNNGLLRNLFLPELLEFKRHYSDKNGKKVQNKAVSLIEKAVVYLNGFLNYGK